ncbi:MAG: prolyl aminopeptidase [Panacagrimonas sp.]
MTESQARLYPATEPHRATWLEVGEGHALYFEEGGRADGVPIVFLHGGPGSGCTAPHRRFFDPAFYRVVLFDQRGCGRSRPAGRLEANTTADLVADIERLREHLGIERWVVFGGSWGSTLALAYARAFPQRVLALVLRGVFLGRKSEVEAFAYGLRGFLPEAWAELAGRFGIHDEQQARDGDLAQRCAEVVLKGSPDEARAVAAAWSRLESEAMAMTAPGTASSASSDPLSARMRIYMHYLANRYFLRDGELLEGLELLRDIPIDIVQGRLDPVCPPVSAWELAQRLPQACLVWVAGCGHGAFEPGLSRALVSATDALRTHLR